MIDLEVRSLNSLRSVLAIQEWMWSEAQFARLCQWRSLHKLMRLLSRFSRARLCVTPNTAAHQALLSLGLSRQEHWSGLPFPYPMHESEKWKWSHLVVSDSCPTQSYRPRQEYGTGVPSPSAMSLSYMAFIVLMYVPFMSPFWRFFIINGGWILSKPFSTSIDYDWIFLFFNLLAWYNTLIVLQKSKNLHIPRINPTWSRYMTLLTNY